MDPKQLAIVERYFVEVMDIPCLQVRVECFLFQRQFTSNAQRVSSSVWQNVVYGSAAYWECVDEHSLVMPPAITLFCSETRCAAAQVDVQPPDCITCLDNWNEAVSGFLYCVAR